MSNNKWHGRGGYLYHGNYSRGKNQAWPQRINNRTQFCNKSKFPDSPENRVMENNFLNLSAESSPYKEWHLYFPEEAFVNESKTHQKIEAFINFISRNRTLYSFDIIEETKTFSLDLKLVTQEETFKSEWSNFLEDLNLNPEHTLNCLGIAVHQSILYKSEENTNELNNVPVLQLSKIRIRILNHEPVVQLRNLKVNLFGKLISLRGTVIRISNVKLLCRWIVFICQTCGAKQIIYQPDGVYTLPNRCTTRGCRCQGRFTPALSSSVTRTENWQLLKLQELTASDQTSEGGRVPRTVDCELTGDLVDACMPGDDVTVTGLVKVRNKEDGGSKTRQASVYLPYMDVVSVVNNKNLSAGSSCATTTIEFNLTDYYAIQKIHSEPSLFRLLVHSLCPTIYGHEVIKAGLLLALLGGVTNNTMSRGDSHVLMVGDPGLGKSQLLQACSNVAPRAVFVCGNTSTSSGLTVTMIREPGGEHSLEAGALVLADQGCCCIDEFDKMSSQHAALLEAMEQQSVSIAKAGVVCSLPARTSVLAAANPAGGHYNRGKTVSENLRLGSALLSRFDLIFILLDKPDEHVDSLLSEHILALHAGYRRKHQNNIATESYNSENLTTDSALSTVGISLKHKLKLPKDEELDVLPHQLLRKYIAYARKYVRPRLSTEAVNVLKTFYLKLRKQHQTADSTPVTARQLESMFRLTQARAKLELREETTELDAIEVIEIMKYSLVDAFCDEYGTIDFTRSQHGSGISGRRKVKEFVNILERKAQLQSHTVFTLSELKEVAARNGITSGFYDLLSSLNLQGFLLKKGNNQYQLQC